jgi:hypothetical protein
LIRDSSYETISEDMLQTILLSEDKISQLEGHFLLLLIAENSIRAYNDPLGKRNLYISQQGKEIFFTSSLPLLKKALHPELDFRAMGVYWHTMFPPSNDRYAPSDKSYYKGVQVMGTGGKALLGDEIRIESQLFQPAAQKEDILSLLESFCLLPVQSPNRIAISLSGGMDIRPLLAVYLKAGADVSAIHYGNDDSTDFRIASGIASKFNIPFRHISYESAEGADSWAQALEYKHKRGIAASPANAPYMGYFAQVAKDFDVYVSGYFGELFRFRFYIAHLKSLFKSKKLGVADLNAYLYRIPAHIFIPEVAREMHFGYRESIQKAFERMPSPQGMLNPFWFNLLLTRYSPFTVNMPNLSEQDSLLLDHMPWLQSGIIAQHWQQGFAFQLAEGVHRSLLRRNYPALEKFPLALADVQAPYFYRQYMLKVKMWHHYRNRPLTRESRADRFLEMNQQNIRDLFASQQVRNVAAYDRASIGQSLDAYYKGNKQFRNELMSWLAVELGR